MTDNPDAVSLIYTLAGTAFLVGIVAGWAFTFARVLRYKRNGYPRPRLLTRDLIVKGGYSLSFTLIVLVRLLPLDVRTALNLGSNVLWALTTSIPAAVASLTYLYYEVWVIDRGTEPKVEPA